MASLQMPANIWIGSSRAERDAFFLQADFDPQLQTIDAGSDAQTVRFTQVDLPSSMLSQVTLEGDLDLDFGVPNVGPTVPGPGDDLRDFPAVPTATPIPVGPLTPLDVGVVPVAGGLSIAGRALRITMGGGGGRILAATWNALPSVARSALTQIGIGVGALIAFNGDIPFITLPGQGGFDASQEGASIMPSNKVDIQIGGHAMHGAQIIGSWNTNPKDPANGVTFYRLVGGWLAVKKKNGSWKTWKPKRPIVLYANGASNLKTMLRADKALNKQAKQLAAMLNRRAPKAKRSTKDTHSPIILGKNAHVIEVAH